ncbi:TPA: glycosyltransferase family 2 protein [Vibrio cholerae]|nr:glycosyltransferase family 2 protein [Vibrio cholerae]
MKEESLVSVIIPMYNVELYIEKCVTSVLEQTYSHVELILIDDGSPDRSGEIAEEIALYDKRVRVIRKQNEGVSRARNIGIDNSNGEYLVFVDSDDYLEPDYISYMINLAKNSGAEFVMSKNCRLFPVNKVVNDNISDSVEVWSPEKATAALLYPGKIEIGCWNKLFLKEFLIINKIRFPEELYMGEGLNFIISAAQKAKKICVGSRRVYNYRKDNQKSATTVVNIPKYINALISLDDIDNNKSIDSPLVNTSIMYHKCMTTYLSLHTIFAIKEDVKYCQEVKMYKSFLRGNYFKFIKGDFLLSCKIKVALFAINPYLAINIINLVKRLIKV